MDVKNARDAEELTISLGGDLSANRRSAGYDIGSRQCSISLEAVWPATGTPAGAFALETLNDGSQASGEAHAVFSRVSVAAKQPSGGAGRLFVDNMETSAHIVCVSYTATSGGAGCVPSVLKLAIKRR